MCVCDTTQHSYPTGGAVCVVVSLVCKDECTQTVQPVARAAPPGHKRSPVSRAGSPACLDRCRRARSVSSVSPAPTRSPCPPSDAAPSPQTSAHRGRHRSCNISTGG